MRIFAVAAVLVCAASGPALAAAWTNEQLAAEGEAIHRASQPDGDGQYGLAVECAEASGALSILIETPVTWDATASYAPEVPVTFVIDGWNFINVAFAFEDRGGRETIVAHEAGQSGALRTMVAALRWAEKDVVIAYFDTTIALTTDNADAAIGPVMDNCAERDPSEDDTRPTARPERIG